MNHLTDEQLSAQLDGALPPRDAGPVAEHLAGCESCRERLAGLSAADASLAGALTNDPGEAYFTAFPDRVLARIAAHKAAGAAVDVARAPARRWWASPRRLAWVGSAFGLLAVATLALVLSRGNGIEGFRQSEAKRAQLPPSANRDAGPAQESEQPRALTAAPPAGAQLDRTQGQRTNDALSPRAKDAQLQRAGRAAAKEPAAGVRGDLATTHESKPIPAAPGFAKAEPAAGNVQPMRALGNGESVPVPAPNRPPLQQKRAPAQGTSGEGGRSGLDTPRLTKPMATPMADQPLAAPAEGARREFSKLALPPAASQSLARDERFTDSLKERSIAPGAVSGGEYLRVSKGRAKALASPADSAVISWRDAMLEDALASREASVAGWTRAGRAWERAVAFAADDESALSARRYLAHARLSSWRLERTRARRAAALEAVDGVLAAAPTGSAHDEALRWRAEVLAAGDPGR